ncbi:hypothetical protein KM043_004187 [Ampulex compressa]|nr:hypothetical protein KM043_004187 [Ampulex compressa]
MTLLVVSQCFLPLSLSLPPWIPRRSPCARRWRPNCDTPWTAGTAIKSQRRRRFAGVRWSTRICRSSPKRPVIARATNTGTSWGRLP